MKFPKKIYVTLVVLSLLLVSSNSAFAYTYLGGKHSSTNLTGVIKSGLNYPYSTLFFNAVQDWDNAGSELNVGVSYGGGGNIYIGGDSFGNVGWNAQCTNYREFIWWGDYTSSVIDVNYSSMDGRSDEYNKSTISHELGHAFGLDHTNDPATIMYTYGNPSRTVTTPQADDINGVNNLY
ncbi:hypothetical protein PAESOLCIP111_04855 [Paenibacillus solanacearum]|uniref:Peptidase M10 metallopeptidase domain-containing protein n=1 Tax=Paenibacillus solanacearum TaxID=2048548 RepID=A0A916NKG0_9BACL|nr:matrixin family metalloprotease [Paenibacillus solanacearum]CAG7645004.1 hypothetical protein PAESOLCIP111_04855 [Paenibacillus solanacearum]